MFEMKRFSSVRKVGRRGDYFTQRFGRLVESGVFYFLSEFVDFVELLEHRFPREAGDGFEPQSLSSNIQTAFLICLLGLGLAVFVSFLEMHKFIMHRIIYSWIKIRFKCLSLIRFIKRYILIA